MESGRGNGDSARPLSPFSSPRGGGLLRALLERDLAAAFTLLEVGEDFRDVALDAVFDRPGSPVRSGEEGCYLALDAAGRVAGLERGQRVDGDRLLELIERLTLLNPPRDLLGDLLDVGAELRQHALPFLDRPVSRDH